MTTLQCDCGKFKAEINNLPQNSPGRCICYCDDCQTYLQAIDRAELLDKNGGTEIIPVYPQDFKIKVGKEFLACIQLSPQGLFRWYTSCCYTPLGNSRPKFPWLGTLTSMYAVNGPDYLQKTMGPIKSYIQGRFAKGELPKGASKKLTLKDFKVVFPFILKGFLTGKAKNSPLFEKDGATPIVKPRILTLAERNEIRERIGFSKI